MGTLISRSTLRASIATVVGALSLHSTVLADGLQSQWRTRVPQEPGAIVIGNVTSQSSTLDAGLSPQHMENRTAAVARRRATSQERVRHTLKESVQRQKGEDSPESLARSRTVFGERQKIRAIRKYERPTGTCAGKNKRDRLVCQREEAYQRTTQYRSFVKNQDRERVAQEKEGAHGDIIASR